MTGERVERIIRLPEASGETRNQHGACELHRDCASPQVRQQGTSSTRGAVVYDTQLSACHCQLVVSSTMVDSSSVTPIVCALLLGVVEEQLNILESWLQVSLDLTPTLDQTAQLPSLLTLTSKTDQRTTVTLHMAIEDLKHLPEPVIELGTGNWELHWFSYPARLTLGNLSLPTKEVAKIRKGTSILIPESFEAVWRVVLDTPAIGLVIVGSYDTNTGLWSSVPHVSDERVTTSTQPTNQRSMRSLTVWFKCLLSVQELVSKDTIEICNGDTHIEHVCYLELNDELQASGKLVPIADGYALHIERIFGGV